MSEIRVTGLVVTIQEINKKTNDRSQELLSSYNLLMNDEYGYYTGLRLKKFVK